MSWAALWKRMAEDNRGPLRLLLPLLIPLSCAIAGAAGLRRQAIQTGWLAQRRLPRPVISVGNLTVGGVGKTPVVIYLAKRLQENGLRPAVLTRGYRRQSTQTEILLPGECADGRLAQCGDEPALISRKANIPVGVDPNRYAAGNQLLQTGEADVFILDDGFQHLSLHRDLDLLVIDAANPWGNGWCLPAGPLREPCRVIHNASALIVRGAQDSALTAQLPLAPFYGQLAWQSLIPLPAWMAQDDSQSQPPQQFAGQSVDLLSGIANPHRLQTQAEDHGLHVARHHVFADHHWYTRAELEAILAQPPERPLLTTEKDAIRLLALEGLPEVWRQRLFVIQTEWRMDDGPGLAAWLISRVEECRPAH